MKEEIESRIGKTIQDRRKERGLTQEQLARSAEVPYTTLIKVESGAIKSPSLEVVSKLAQALSISLDSLVTPTVFRGKEALSTLFADILNTLKVPGDWMGITGVSETTYLKNAKVELIEFIETLRVRGFHQRILSSSEETVFLQGEHLHYRAIPKEYFSEVPFYMYGNKIAILVWGEPTQVIIMENSPMAESLRKFFLFVWDKATPVKRKR